MSLHFDLKINGHPIGYFNARRIAGGADVDDINTYDVEFTDLQPPYGYTRFQLTHRYGDGAWKLVELCTAELTRIREASPTRRPEHAAP